MITRRPSLSRYVANGQTTFNGNPDNGHIINPYYKVDDHPYHGVLKLLMEEIRLTTSNR